MQQYYDIYYTVNLMQYTADNGSVYDIHYVAKIWCDVGLRYIYTFGNLIEHIGKPPDRIKYWSSLSNMVSYISQCDVVTNVLYIAKDQFVIKTCYEVE